MTQIAPFIAALVGALVIPVLLGGGIPLLSGESKAMRTGLELAGERSFENGVVELRYRRRR